MRLDQIAHRIERSVLLCTNPRSGSWLLATALEQTGIAGRPKEYFRPDYDQLFRTQFGLDADAPYDRFVERALNAGTTPNGVFAAKVHWYQFQHLLTSLRRLPGCAEQADHELAARFLPNLAYVHLYREDVARAALSWYRALQTDVWWDVDGNRPPDLVDPASVKPDYEYISGLEKRLVRENECWPGFFEAAGVTPFRIGYDELTFNFEATVLKVLRYVAPAIPPHLDLPAPALKKQADHITELWVRQYLARKRPAATASEQPA